MISSTGPSPPPLTSCSHIHARADRRCGVPRLENRNKLQKIQFARKRVFCCTRTDIRLSIIVAGTAVSVRRVWHGKTRSIYILITRRAHVIGRGVCLVAANYPRTACGSRWPGKAEFYRFRTCGFRACVTSGGGDMFAHHNTVFFDSPPRGTHVIHEQRRWGEVDSKKAKN